MQFFNIVPTYQDFCGNLNINYELLYICLPFGIKRNFHTVFSSNVKGDNGIRLSHPWSREPSSVYLDNLTNVSQSRFGGYLLGIARTSGMDRVVS